MSKGPVFHTRPWTSMDNHDDFSATERKPSVPHDGPVFHTRPWTSMDNHDHFSATERKPSVPHDGPRFPNIHRHLSSRVVTFDEDFEEAQERFHRQFPNKPPKRVQVAEQEQIIAEDGKGRREVVDQSIETEADCFIRQKHRSFDLCKWNTFKK